MFRFHCAQVHLERAVLSDVSWFAGRMVSTLTNDRSHGARHPDVRTARPAAPLHFLKLIFFSSIESFSSPPQGTDSRNNAVCDARKFAFRQRKLVILRGDASHARRPYWKRKYTTRVPPWRFSQSSYKNDTVISQHFLPLVLRIRRFYFHGTWKWHRAKNRV